MDINKKKVLHRVGQKFLPIHFFFFLSKTSKYNKKTNFKLNLSINIIFPQCFQKLFIFEQNYSVQIYFM